MVDIIKKFLWRIYLNFYQESLQAFRAKCEYFKRLNQHSIRVFEAKPTNLNIIANDVDILVHNLKCNVHLGLVK